MKTNKYWQRIFLIGTALVVLFWGLYNLTFLQNVLNRTIQVTTPFIIGFAMAFIINLPMKYIEEKITKLNKGKYHSWYRIITVILSLLVVVLIIAFIIFLVLPDIQNTFSYFINAVPSQINSLLEVSMNFIERNPELVENLQQLNIDWNSVQSNLINGLRNIVTTFLSSILNYIPTIINSLFDLVVSIIFAIYLLFSKESLLRHFKKLIYGIFDLKWANFLMNFGTEANEIFSGFIGGQMIAGILTGIVLYLLMILFNFPYALSISVLTAITTLIPFYGAIFGGAIGFLLISVVNFSQAVWFILLIVVVQQVEGNILYPNVVGNSIGIPGIWVMVTVTLGGALFGLPGMFLSVPIFSLFYRVLADTINYRLREENINISSETSQVSPEDET